MMIDWGSIPEWFAAVGTVAALGVAAFAYRHDVWHRQRAQARLVYVAWHGSTEPVKVKAFEEIPDMEEYSGAIVGPLLMESDEGRPREDGWLYGLAIINPSDEIVPEARILVGDDVYLLPRGGAVGPGATRLVAFAHPGSRLYFLPGLQFMDSTGRWWTRFWMDPVERAREIDKEERKVKKQWAARMREADRKREKQKVSERRRESGLASSQ